MREGPRSGKLKMMWNSSLVCRVFFLPGRAARYSQEPISAIVHPWPPASYSFSVASSDINGNVVNARPEGEDEVAGFSTDRIEERNLATEHICAIKEILFACLDFPS